MKFGNAAFTVVVVVVSWATAAAAAASAASAASNARLPYGLQKVVADFQQQQQQQQQQQGSEEEEEEEGGVVSNAAPPSSILTATACCLVTSQSVTRREKKSLLQALVGDMDETGAAAAAAAAAASDYSSTTAIVTQNGLILAILPDNAAIGAAGDDSSLAGGATTIAGCGGNVLYYPSAVDVSRGEGLFTTLAPVMEQIVLLASSSPSSSSSESSSSSKPSLVVVVPDDDDENDVSIDMCKVQLERAAETVLSHLVVGNHNAKNQPTPLSLLQDVFVGGVQYISKRKLDSDLSVLVALGASSSVDDIASRIQQATSSSSSSSTSAAAASSMTGNDLASARILGPRSRIVLQECLQSVLSQTVVDDDDAGEGDDSGPRRKLVLDFGNLVRVSLQQGLKKLDETTTGAVQQQLQSCTVTKQIRSALIGQFHQGIASELQEQLLLLQAVCFDDFKRGLSKLILSPQLASDMAAVGNTAIASFAKQAKLIVTGATSKNLADQVYTTTKQEFASGIQQTCAHRLLTARANGKFRPLPRKGVTVGLHWLLPKPFGNDYRQEPWMVHATDNMVYIPQGPSSKVQNVNPNDVQSGVDWKNKIVPSPIGNDMIYVQ